MEFKPKEINPIFYRYAEYEGEFIVRRLVFNLLNNLKKKGASNIEVVCAGKTIQSFFSPIIINNSLCLDIKHIYNLRGKEIEKRFVYPM